MTAIKILPWVGRHYNDGIQGKRVMVLGDSHYCENPADATPQLTIDIISDLLNPNSVHEGYKNTYTKFERALAGKPLSAAEKEDVWHSVLFYNYVQSPVSQARISPTAQQFAESEEAFFEVLNRYRPHRVIVWGQRLNNHLPNNATALPDLPVPGSDPLATRAYTLPDGHCVQLLPVWHPSAGFAWDYWHGAIMAFLQRD